MTQRMDLNGSWKLRWNDGQRGGGINRVLPLDADLHRAIDATVPGEVHLDLMKAGIIAEPADGLNALTCRWVEETFWYYRREFTAPAPAAGAAEVPVRKAFLVFETLDLAAVVYLNGVEVGRHANAFYPCRIDVTDKLRPGVNVLVVQVESGVFYASEKPGSGYGMSVDSQLVRRNWLRTVQSSFGWDWSLRLLNVGIRGNVYLEVCPEVRFDRLTVLSHLSEDLARGTVTARVFTESFDDRKRAGVLTVRVEETGQCVEVPVEILPGHNAVEARVEVNSPDLWWPVGHGAQPLYTVAASLAVYGMAGPDSGPGAVAKILGADSRRVAFRHVNINQSPHPEGGRYFIIEINHKPIFVKGGNFVPADPIFARIDRRRYETLVDRALEANFNLLRIWGGGLYESDDLYDLCDCKGVLVWQEFIFACAKYPATDEHFLADFKREATHQVRRLAHHASLIVWCGNNEMEWGGYSWGFEKGVSHPDYALFHLVLPRILNQEDGTRYYQPSSPYSPDHAHPNADDVGDQHPWSIGFADSDFRKYRQMTCRFPNEGGILGSTSLPTVRKCLPPPHDRPGSFAWEMHENSIAYVVGDRLHPDEMMRQWLGKDLADMSLEDYVYWAGVCQGEGLAEYIRNFRRRMFSSASAVFWMYNDNWPMVRSWTIVDYDLRRTPSFHPVRRALAPVTVALVYEEASRADGAAAAGRSRVRVFGINEGPLWKGEVRFGIFALAGGLPLDQSRQVELPANASTLLAEFDAAGLDRLEPAGHGAFALLSAGGREIARDRLFLPFWKDMAWPGAQVAVRRQNGQAIFTSKTFAWRVCLDLDGDRALSDNFFDVLPGIPTVLDWPDALGDPVILRVGNLI